MPFKIGKCGDWAELDGGKLHYLLSLYKYNVNKSMICE
jgi:hypothetical protein